MRQIYSVEDTLELKPYPPATGQVEPVPTHYFLPNYVYLNENDKPKIGVWDDEKQEWSTEYVVDTPAKPERKLEFALTKFAPIAYL